MTVSMGPCGVLTVLHLLQAARKTILYYCINPKVTVPWLRSINALLMFLLNIRHRLLRAMIPLSSSRRMSTSSSTSLTSPGGAGSQTPCGSLLEKAKRERRGKLVGT